MKCPFCGKTTPDQAAYCYHCGSNINRSGREERAPSNIELIGDDDYKAKVFASTSETYSPFPSGNSVEGLERVKGWNWGAAILTWIWAFGNGLSKIGAIVLVASMFIPFVPIIASFYLGMKGNELLWQEKPCLSVEEFKAVQQKWATGAFIFFAVMIVFIIIVAAGVFTFMAPMLNDMPSY